MPSTTSLIVEDVHIATKPGIGKRLLLTLSYDGDIDAVAAQITQGEELNVELPTHSPPG